MTDVTSQQTKAGAASSPRGLFEGAWQIWRPGDSVPRWDRHLPQSGDIEAVCNLIQTDIEFRVKAGMPALLSERYFYHPQLKGLLEFDISRKAELVRWEYQLRWRNKQRVRRQDYRDAFPELSELLADLRPRWNCPTCRHAGIAADEELSEKLTCPRCSSTVEAAAVFPLSPATGSTPTHADGRGRDNESYPAVPGYEFLAQLGKGGMGIVFKARQLSLNRLVALKWIRAGDATADDLARFQSEAESAARLQHPGIVQIFEIGAVGNRPYFTLEYVAGGSLDKVLGGVPQPPRRAARIVEAIARAVHEAHRHGILHRDLKPANVLLSPRADANASDELPWELKIADFGLAKRVAEGPGQTHPGMVLGTPSYMPPEQAEGRKDLGPAVDIYSLGVMLYEALTGVLPFRAASAWETLRLLLTEEPVSPARLQPGVPRDLETICLKCLEKDPARRYPSAAALADDLGRFLRGEPVVARPVGRLARGWRWCRRNPLAASLVASVALLLVAVATVSAVLGQVARDEAREARLARDGEAKKAKEALEAQERERQRAREAKEEAAKARIAEASERKIAGEEKAARARADAEEKKAKHALFLYRLTDAQRYWDDGHVAAARAKLHEAREFSDTWEYRHLHTKINHSGQRTITGHRNAVMSVAYSPDGSRLASADQLDSIRVWDVATGRQLLLVPGHTSVSFSPDGRRLAVPFSNHLVKIWDAANGAELVVLKGHQQQVRKVTFNLDGSQLATTAHDMTVRIWDATTGKEIRTINSGVVLSVAFSPDGKRLVTAGSDAVVRVWEVGTGKEQFAIKNAHAHFGSLHEATSAIFSLDGKRFASTGSDGIARIWDAESGKELLTLRGHMQETTGACFSPDGRWLATASADQTVKVWDTKNQGLLLYSFKGHTNGVTSVCFSPGADRIATASWDRTVKVWDLRLGQSPALRGHFNGVLGIAYSRDGRKIATASVDMMVKVWDATTGQEEQSLVHWNAVTGVAFSPDGRRLVAGDFDQKVKVWDLASGKSLHTLVHGHEVRGVAYSPDGVQVASAGADSTVQVWNVEQGKRVRTLKGHAGTVFAVAFSPDGKYLASAGMDQTLRLWDANTGEEVRVLKGHTSTVFGVAFSPDGSRLVSAGEAVKVWDVATGKNLRTFTGHTIAVEHVAFSPDAKRLATAGTDQTVRIWDAETGDELLSLKGHTAQVKGVAFSPDGSRLVSAALDRDVKIWDAKVRPVQEAESSSGWRWWIDTDPLWHEHQARGAEKQSDWFAAAFHFQRLHQEQIWNTSTRLRRAYALAQMEKPVEASVEILTALWLNPRAR